MVKILKYLSMNNLMGLPNFQINPATRKYRADLLMADAIRKLNKLMSKAPAVMVNTLNGIGVKPAVKTIQKFHTSYLSWMT